MPHRLSCIAIVVALGVSLAACTPHVEVLLPRGPDSRSPQSDQKAQEQAEAVRSSLEASAQAVLGRGVTVEATTLIAEYDDSAINAADSPFAANFEISAYPEGEPESAYRFEVRAFNGERRSYAGGHLAPQALADVDLAANELAGFADMPEDRIAPMLRHLSKLGASPQDELDLFGMESVWKDGLGVEIPWQKALREQCISVGYSPIDCVVLTLWPRGPNPEEETYQLLRFDAATRQWVELAELRGDPSSGGFVLDRPQRPS